ncbi:MAG: hypothetical protein AB7G23_08915 [Vicinamibacterales bacterium]
MNLRITGAALRVVRLVVGVAVVGGALVGSAVVGGAVVGSAVAGAAPGAGGQVADAPDPVALQAGAATCTDPDSRFADCLDGTVRDGMTGLTWLQHADCLTTTVHAEAGAVVARLADGQCGLTDGSVPGDWRLPTREEWSATLTASAALGCRLALAGGQPLLTDRTWAECFQELEQRTSDGRGTLYGGVASAIYLSGVTSGEGPGVAWLPFLGDGDSNFIGTFGQGFSLRLWPVRGRPAPPAP